MAYERPTTAVCANCKVFAVGPNGRVPKFARLCRVAAFDKSHRGPKVSPADRQRLLMWGVLQDAGLIPADKPLPMRKPGDAA
jgi:hypothetical protein